MPSSLRRESPLIDFLAGAPPSPLSPQGSVLLEELAFWGHINFRGNPNDPGLADNVQGVLGVSLPVLPNTAAVNGTTTALWLGPDEWLLVTSPGSEAECVRELRLALQTHHVAVTDITDGQTILRLSGPHATDVLRKGCGLDLHPGSFRPGQCAQTQLDKIGVVLHKLDDSPRFDVVVRRSFSHFLATWLKDAAAE